jgi:sugar/nucleoside kinase (ribokinase family)
VALVDRYPAEDTLANIASSKSANGGAAYNVLCDLAHLGTGLPLAAAGLVGDDPEGREIRARCARLGLDTRHLHITDRAPTSYSDIMTVAGTGRRTIFHLRGANALFDRHHLDLGASRARVFFLGFLGLLDRLDAASRTHGTVAAQVLAEARRRGLITCADVVSDPSGRLPHLVRAALPHLDYLLLNETEAELVTGLGVRARGGLDRGRLLTAAAAIAERGLAGWLILHAAEGALALRRGHAPVWQGSVRMPRRAIKGTNGAGDAFAAGFLHGVHEGVDLPTCLRRAACVAAASLTDTTPSDGVRSLRACLALGKRHGFRA